MNNNTKELIDILLTIKVAAERLAANLIEIAMKNGDHDEDHQCVCCPYCCDAEDHTTDN